MADYIFSPCFLADIDHFVQRYVVSLASPIDSFLEDHIVGSEIYTITGGEEVLGYFALHQQKLLTQFCLERQFLRHGQPIFRQILRQFQPEAAFVPTADELFLSHALDPEVTVHKQAYFFQDCREIDVTHKLDPSGDFRVATPEDQAEIEQMSGDFFDRLGERIGQGGIFVLTEADELLGAGIVERGKLLKTCASIGMFTHEAHRQKGVGRSIIIHLKQWCYEHGLIPIAGCWYYNFNSKKTLESAGMITKTRLLRIEFLKEPS